MWARAVLSQKLSAARTLGIVFVWTALHREMRGHVRVAVLLVAVLEGVDAALLVGAAAVAGAMFLILELDQPLSGLMSLSTKPLRHAIEGHCQVV